MRRAPPNVDERSDCAIREPPHIPAARVSMLTIAGLLAALLYLGATALVGQRLGRLAAGAVADKRALLFTWAGALALHALVILSQTISVRGLNLAFFHALSIVTLLVAGVLWATAIRRPVENLGFAVLPAAALAIVIVHLRPGAHVMTPNSAPLYIHIVTSLAAYSVLTIAALQAILLSVQDHQLHNRKPGGLVRALPPLQWMEHLLFQLIALGFVLLSAALITGFVFLEDIFAQHLVHKTVLSIAAWCVFAVLLWGRWRFGWRGRTAIRGTLIGFVVLMVAYFGSKLVLELILHRGGGA